MGVGVIDSPVEDDIPAGAAMTTGCISAMSRSSNRLT